MLLLHQLVLWFYMFVLFVIPTLVLYLTQLNKPLKLKPNSVQVLNYFFNHTTYRILRKYNNLPKLQRSIDNLVPHLTKDELNYLLENYDVKIDYKVLFKMYPRNMFRLFSLEERCDLYDQLVTSETKHELMPLLGKKLIDYYMIKNNMHGSDMVNSSGSVYQFSDSINDPHVLTSGKLDYNNITKHAKGLIPSKYLNPHLHLCQNLLNITKPSESDDYKLVDDFVVVNNDLLSFMLFNQETNKMMSFHGNQKYMGMSDNLLVRPLRFERDSAAEYLADGGIYLYPISELVKKIKESELDIFKVVPVKVSLKDIYYNKNILFTYQVKVLDNIKDELDVYTKEMLTLKDFDNLEHKYERFMRKKVV